MTQETGYAISELADAAGVTPRTIRFYAAEGLLPPPETQGRYAYYTAAHLQRLRLIQRLKQAFLPLSTIRTQLESLSEADVETLLAQCSSTSGSDSDEKSRVYVQAIEPHSQQSRLEYIAQILAVTGQSKPGAVSTEASTRPPRALLISPTLRPVETEPSSTETAEPSLQPAERPISSAATSDSAGRETWERIPLASGVELHIRVPDTPAERERLEQRIAAIKAQFASDTE